MLSWKYLRRLVSEIVAWKYSAKRLSWNILHFIQKSICDGVFGTFWIFYWEVSALEDVAQQLYLERVSGTRISWEFRKVFRTPSLKTTCVLLLLLPLISQLFLTRNSSFSLQVQLLIYIAKQAKGLLNFLVWKFCGNAQFLLSFISWKSPDRFFWLKFFGP